MQAPASLPALQIFFVFFVSSWWCPGFGRLLKVADSSKGAWRIAASPNLRDCQSN
jgi:hypothetical protein